MVYVERIPRHRLQGHVLSGAGGDGQEEQQAEGNAENG